ncbi:MAG: hypothetical protein LBH28_04150 [Oscillospiraceae bacterium]|nr:hypothetical protein [Oscillospiraceae bacterium]
MPAFVQNTADETAGMDPADIQQNRAMGGVAYFLFFLPLVVCPQSKYGRFHANQSLLLLILDVAVVIVNIILSAIFLGISWRLYWLVSITSLLLWLGIAAFYVIGLINGFSGKAKELPVIGKIRLIK